MLVIFFLVFLLVVVADKVFELVDHLFEERHAGYEVGYARG